MTEAAVQESLSELLPEAQQAVAIVPKKRHKFSLGPLQSVAVAVVIAVFFITFLFQAFQIPSESMENTLLVGDFLLVDKVHYANGGIWGQVLPYRQIHRGDIIVFRPPVHPEQHFVKRVIALPGDRVHLINKRVYVNGDPIQEMYAVHTPGVLDRYRDDFPQPNPVPEQEPSWWMQMRGLVHNGELEVPADSYFVLGDNREHSLDSRYWGFVPRQNIIGRPLLIYWSMENDTPAASSLAPDKLSRLADVLYYIVHIPRWHRALHVVQ